MKLKTLKMANDKVQNPDQEGNDKLQSSNVKKRGSFGI